MSVARLLEALDTAKFSHISRHKLLICKQVERRVEAISAAMWDAQRKAVLRVLDLHRSSFKEASNPPDVDPLDADLNKALSDTSMSFTSQYADAFAPAYNGGAEATAASLVGSLPPEFSQPNAAATDYLQNHSSQLISGLDDTTRGKMQDLLADSRASGDSYSVTADKINAMFTGFDSPSALGHIQDRAQLVAVTESANAYEQGSKDTISGLVSLGLNYEKSWLAAEDACPTCQENAGDGWIPFEDEHITGDTEPPGHPGCRCAEVYQRVDSNLTDGESAAVDQYLSDDEFGSNLDEWLRDGAPYANPEFEDAVEKLDSALAKSVLERDVEATRMLSNTSCSSLAGSSIQDSGFGLFSTGDELIEVFRSASASTLQLLQEAAISQAQVLQAINAGKSGVDEIAAHHGIIGADNIVKAKIRPLLRKMAKAGTIVPYAKGTKVHYALPGAPVPVEGAVVKVAKLKVPKGSPGLVKGSNVLLPRESKFGAGFCDTEAVGLNPVASVAEDTLGAVQKAESYSTQLLQDGLNALDDDLAPYTNEVGNHLSEIDTYVAAAENGMYSQAQVDQMLSAMMDLTVNDYPKGKDVQDLFTKLDAIHNQPKVVAPVINNITRPVRAAVRMPTADELRDMKVVPGPIGTQAAQWYQDPATGIKYFAKFPKDVAVAQNELAANIAYQVAGAAADQNTARQVAVTLDGKFSLVSKEIKNLQKLDLTDGEQLLAAQKLFGMDAILSNWDVVGAGTEHPMENLLWNTETRQVVRVDTGGAMQFGGLGNVKAQWRTGPFTDWQTMRDSGLNPSTAKVFGKMTDQQVAQSLKYVQDNLDLSKLAQAWKDAGIPEEQIVRNLGVISDRLNQIPGILGKLNPQLAVPGHWTPSDVKAWKAMLTPDEKESVRAYTGSIYRTLNETVIQLAETLRAGNPLSGSYLQHDQNMLSAFEKSQNDVPLHVKRNISPNDHEMTAFFKNLQPGDVYRDDGYSSTSLTNPFGGSVRLEIDVPAGRNAMYVKSISLHPSEDEVILPAGTQFLVTKVDQSAYVRTIHVEMQPWDRSEAIAARHEEDLAKAEIIARAPIAPSTTPGYTNYAAQLTPPVNVPGIGEIKVGDKLLHYNGETYEYVGPSMATGFNKGTLKFKNLDSPSAPVLKVQPNEIQNVLTPVLSKQMTPALDLGAGKYPEGATTIWDAHSQVKIGDLVYNQQSGITFEMVDKLPNQFIFEQVDDPGTGQLALKAEYVQDNMLKLPSPKPAGKSTILGGKQLDPGVTVVHASGKEYQFVGMSPDGSYLMQDLMNPTSPPLHVVKSALQAWFEIK